MNTQPNVYKAKAFGSIIQIFVIALVMTACASNTLATPTIAISQLANQADAAKHAPVILQVVERTSTEGKQTIIYEDITFTDSEGDATTIVDKLVLSSQDASASNVEIQVAPDEQKNSATVTDAWECGANPMIIVETRILDKAGNLSEPVKITISCPTVQPNIQPFLIAGLVLGLGLLLGAWLFLRNRPDERRCTFQSLLMLFCMLFPLYFTYLILHEGGHGLTSLIYGGTVEMFYVHPFSFSGYNLPPFDWNSVLYHAGGAMFALPASLVILFLFWKGRSVSTLPFVALFPWVAIHQGLRILTVGGDFSNIVRLTGLPTILFVVTGFLIVGVGIIFFISLLPLFGLAPGDRKSLFVLPTALLLWSVVGMVVSYLFVPGSPIDVQYHLRGQIFNGAISFLAGPIIGMLLAILNLTLYRNETSKLPAWLRSRTVPLTWIDIKLPILLASTCVIVGLLVIT